MEENKTPSKVSPEVVRSRREKVIQLALAELGYKENPPNSNRTKFNDWFYLTPADIQAGKHADGPSKSWCCVFCMKILDEAGIPIGRADYFKGYASVPNLLTECKKPDSKIGCVVPYEQAEPGDLVIYDWDGNGAPDHIGFLHKKINSIQFSAIEGNTGKSNDSNGGEVMDRDDRRNSIGAMKVYFVRPYVYYK